MTNVLLGVWVRKMKFKGIVSDCRNLHPSTLWAGFCYRLDLGAASSESAAGSGPGRLPRAAAVESAAVSVVALSCGLCVLLLVVLDGCDM